MRLCLDSSAMVKNYIAEPGSGRVRSLLREADVLTLSVLVRPEVISSLNRLRRDGELDDLGYVTAKREFMEDFGEATVVDLTEEILDGTTRCLETAKLRASDAVHVATALEAKPDRFVSADRRQCEAARTMGLEVEEITGQDDTAGGGDGPPR